MRNGVVDIARIQAAIQTRQGPPWTGDEWRRQLHVCGLLVDLAGEEGTGDWRGVVGVQRALRTLLDAEAGLVDRQQPVPWSVGGAPPWTLAVIAVTVIVITAEWNLLYGLFGGAVVLGAVALVGLNHHRRLVAERALLIEAARAALLRAREDLLARVLALSPSGFPIETPSVRVVAGVVPRF